MTAPNLPLRSSIGKAQSWQTDAWEYFDIIGELRFGVLWIANAMSRVNLIAAAPAEGPGDEPTPVDLADSGFTPAQRRAAEIVATIAGGPIGQGQILSAFGIQLSVAGIGWLVIEPDLADPTADQLETWQVYSTEEVRSSSDGDNIEIQVSSREWRPVHPNAIVIKCWRRHPRRSWEPDAPTHGVLNVLREIDLLQKHIQASAQSRLAGAGLLAIPSEAVFPPGQGPQSTIEDINADDQNTNPPEDSFVETLIDAMTVPITDRGSAAAVVPLVVKVPGEYVDKITHLSFATPFDAKVTDLLDRAIRRLALGMDIPPEVLTGKGDTNHWSAWQVQEESITLHIEPLSEVVAQALTIGYLRPALQAEGFDPDEVMVWYDTTDLRTRPDRSRGAVEAYDRSELSGAALLRELGLSVDDAPTPEEKREKILLAVARGAPTLAPQLLAELGLLDAATIALPVEESNTPNTPNTPTNAETAPNTAPETKPESTTEPPSGEALVAACDVLVNRALERAGSRLRSAIGKKTAGGPAAVACDDPTKLHLRYDATEHADLNSLLDGAWTLATPIAERSGINPQALIDALDAYTRALLASRQEHDYDRLCGYLGISSSV